MSRKAKQKNMDILLTLLAIVIGLLVVFPIVYAVLSAFKTKAEFGFPPALLPESFSYLDNFTRAFSQAPLLRFIANSFIMAMIGATLRIMIAGLAAFSFSFYEFKGKNFLFLLLVATMMLPGDILLITNYLTVSSLHLTDNFLGMVIPSLLGASQLFMLRQNFRIIPKELQEAAVLDGCSDWLFVKHVIFPISRPVLVILFIQSFIYYFNSYLWPLLITNETNMRTIQVGLALMTNLEDTNYGVLMAAVTVVLLPSFGLLYLLRKTSANEEETSAFI